MSNEDNKEDDFNMTAKTPQVRFGILAVENGLITARQLGKAVNVQMKEDLSGMKHRLLGEILIDMGFMTENQVNEVLKAVKGDVVSQLIYD